MLYRCMGTLSGASSTCIATTNHNARLSACQIIIQYAPVQFGDDLNRTTINAIASLLPRHCSNDSSIADRYNSRYIPILHACIDLSQPSLYKRPIILIVILNRLQLMSFLTQFDIQVKSAVILSPCKTSHADYSD